MKRFLRFISVALVVIFLSQGAPIFVARAADPGRPEVQEALKDGTGGSNSDTSDEKKVKSASKLIDSPYDFGLSDKYVPISPTMSMKEIYEQIRAGMPDEIPVVMPRAVKGAVRIFVSPTGSDNGDGSIDNPFQTIQKALSAVAETSETKKAGGVVVYLRKGTYKLTETVKINSAMSGSEKFPLYIAAYNGEDVSITASDTLTSNDFTPVTDKEKLDLLPASAKQKVVVADLKALGITKYNEILHGFDSTGVETKLYWNDKAMTLSRYPNYDYLPVGKVLDAGPITRVEGGGAGVPDDGRGIEFELKDRRPLEWKKTDDLYLYGFMSFEWLPAQYKVRKLNAETNSVRTYDTAMYGAREKPGNKYYFFNVFEELDVPGEWYLDRTEGKLYVYPYDDLKTASVYLSTSGMDLITVENAKHVYFDGLTLKANSESGFVFKNSENIVVQNSVISLMGKLGVYMNGCTYSGVTSSLIYNTDGTGIHSEGNEARDNLLIPSRNFVQNNFITRQGNSSHESGYMGGSMGDIVSHNLFQKFAASAVRPTGNESVFEYNEIAGAPYEVSDMGSIYTGGVDSPYHTDRFNYIHDMSVSGKMGNAIYYDVFGSGFMAYGNVLNNISTGIYSHGGRNNVILNNIIAGRVNGQSNAITNSKNYYDSNNNSWKAQILDRYSIFRKYYTGLIDMTGGPYSERYPMWDEYLTKLFEWCRDQIQNPNAPRGDLENWLRAPSGSYIENNVSFLHGDFVMDDIAKPVIGFENNYKTDQNPGFVDYENGNLNLKADSVIYKQLDGFEPIPFDKMGLVPGNVWKNVKFKGWGITEAPTAVYPADNSKGQDGFDRVVFKWTDVLGAGRYVLEVAADPDFKNVILGKQLDLSTSTEKLPKMGTKYYWKVKTLPMAKSLSNNVIESKVYSFTTMTFDEMNAASKGGADKKAFAAEIQYAEGLLAKIEEGSSVGQYKAGTKVQMQSVIDAAKEAYVINNIQTFVDQAMQKFINDFNALRKNVVVGFQPIEDFSAMKWVEVHNPAGSVSPEAPANVVYADGIVTMTTKTDGSPSRIAWDEPMEMGKLYTFRMKIESTDGWFVLGKLGNKNADFAATKDYCIIIKPDVLELQKYTENKVYWIIDQAVNDNKIIKPDTWHDYAYGTFAEGDGVRVLFMVDGKPVINFLDAVEPIYYEGNLVIRAHDANKTVQFEKSQLDYSGIQIPSVK